MTEDHDAPEREREEPPTSQKTSRRSFLKTAGFTAAGVAVGGAAGGAVGATLGARAGGKRVEVEEELRVLPPRKTPGFDHLVVVMYENRSFDNLLGYLYDKKTLPKGQKFDGLNFGEYSNHDPITGGRVPAHVYFGATDVVMRHPQPDPGEEYPHVNTQLFGTVDPLDNGRRLIPDMVAPFNAPPSERRPTMDGFVTDYINSYRAEHANADPQENEYRIAMGSFAPEMLPVFSTLAQSFAVYDNWHCAVPSQIFCNRSFFHASTSHGYVINGGDGGYGKWFDRHNATPTIFNRLEDAGLPWRVYFDANQLISLTGFIHAPVLEKYWTTNFRTMDDFFDDVENGTLPAYSFIEPRMVYDHNDMHPPVGPYSATDVDGSVITGGGISDVRAGEALMHRIYSAIRTSTSEKGSNAMNTMLFVTFDEHGGTYDHVRPPAAVAPQPTQDTEMGFAFNRLGLRVPAIAISAYTARKVINDPMHHGSVVSTLTKKYNLKSLTKRDAGAPTLMNAVNLGAPRQPATWPQTHPQWLPANPEAQAPYPGGDDDRPLSPPGVGLVGMLTAHFGGDETKIPRTYREAYELIDKHGRGLFGSY